MTTHRLDKNRSNSCSMCRIIQAELRAVLRSGSKTPFLLLASRQLVVQPIQLYTNTTEFCRMLHTAVPFWMSELSQVLHFTSSREVHSTNHSLSLRKWRLCFYCSERRSFPLVISTDIIYRDWAASSHCFCLAAIDRMQWQNHIKGRKNRPLLKADLKHRNNVT